MLSLYLGKSVFTANRGPFKNFALNTVQPVEQGYVSVDTELFELKGKTGITQTVLRPGGKIIIEDEVYDAVAETGFIDKDEKVVVTRLESVQLFVELVDE